MYNWLFVWCKNIVLFSRYLDIVFLLNQLPSKSMTSSWALFYSRSCTFDCFLTILSSIKIIFDQNLVQLMTNISNSFLVLLFLALSIAFLWFWQNTNIMRSIQFPWMLFTMMFTYLQKSWKSNLSELVFDLPFSCQCFASMPSGNIRKPLVFWRLQGV